MSGTKTVENALHISPIISNKMANAIELWSDMYEDKSPWLKRPSYADPVKITSLGLPAFIASEKARMATLEMKSEISSVNKEKAEYMNKQYQKLLANIRNHLEYGIAKGGIVIKPYVILSENNNYTDGQPKTSQMEFDYIQADGFFPLAFDASGKITEAAFIQREIDKDIVYSRLEHHKLQGTTITIQNRAFKSKNLNQTNSITGDNDLGQEISLKEVPKWANLQPEQKIVNVDRLMFAYFKMPEANTVDPYCPLGVSGYSRAVNLIKEADKQYSRLLWEFEGGELAVDIDRNSLMDELDDKGNIRKVRPQLQNRLFRQVEIQDMYNVFSPALRDQSLINGLNTILMRIEDVCALSRGTLSDVNDEAKTATELKILKQRSYSANLDIQKALERTLRDVVYIIDVYCTLYNIAHFGEYEVSFEWDDSIITDADTELNKRIMLMQNGLVSKVENRMWYFGETENQAKEALAKIEHENQNSMENNLMAE